jgi:mannose-1-phosphate guanylyltransferase
MKAILLIGGLGTRLRPLTFKTPKPLLPILDHPFLAYQLDFLRRMGFDDIVLCTAYKAEDFRQAFGDGKRHGVRIAYVHEEAPLGTGGAIKNAERFVEGPTLICNGDILMSLNLRELWDFHAQKKALVSIGLTEVTDPSAYGVVELKDDGRIVKFVEKPAPGEAPSNLINAGAYVFNKEAFELIPAGTVYSVERGLFPKLLEMGRPCYGKHLAGYWLDVGTLEKYEQAQRDVQEGRYPFRPGQEVVR